MTGPGCLDSACRPHYDLARAEKAIIANREEAAGLKYRFYGGPFEGERASQIVLGEWVVLFYDEHQRRTSSSRAYALAAYRKETAAGEASYRFAYCLTPKLQRFLIDFADGPHRGAEVSTLPMIWLPAELVRPLNEQFQALPGARRASNAAKYLAHYKGRTVESGFEYFLSKVSLAPCVCEPAFAA